MSDQPTADARPRHCWLRLRFHRWFIVKVVPMALGVECERCGKFYWWEG